MHQPLNTAILASTWVLPLLFAIILHEVAHGYAAYYFGDNTAKNHGRLSLNPIKHIDMTGTVILPLLLFAMNSPFLFGWAKPVPVAFQNLRNPKKHMIWVALAGPATNIVLAFISAMLMGMFASKPADVGSVWVFLNLNNSLNINLILMLFNMIPFPPLDGGKVAIGLLPIKLAVKFAKLERHGFMILLIIIFGLPYIGDIIGVDMDYLQKYLSFSIHFFKSAFLSFAGI